MQLEQPLRGIQVLVVNDEYLLTDDLAQGPAIAGALVLGPAQSIERTLETIASADRIDAAVLNVNVRGKVVYPVADTLLKRRVTVMFTTGYNASVLTAPYDIIACFEKPVDLHKLIDALGGAIHTEP